ncbi:MAG: 2-oxo acid dehydrogenase subunit E2 [Ignavibacteriales bacterium]|nr:2-oxo acid dehydrogenase subunit E2 [Ignavibacteriales bacterium]
MSKYKTKIFPKSRIATIDICEIGKKKHHVVVFLEIDVTIAREKVKIYKKDIGKISFIAWLIKVIANTLSSYSAITAYKNGKQKTIIFDDINVSFLIEKEINGEKVPLPVLIEKANTHDIEKITKQINDSKQETLSENQIVIQKRTTHIERFYYFLPGFIRRAIWKYLLKHPKIVFSKMGNVAITSLGIYGKINGWFIPISIHPICFGIGSIIKKPVVINDKIEVREIMNVTVLMDHDVIDGASMARFIGVLTKNIEKGLFL